MKYLFLVFLLFLSSTCFGYEYHFVYMLNCDKLEYKTKADSWDEAFTRGADFCVDFFAKRGKVDQERGLDIIDACSNPRLVK